MAVKRTLKRASKVAKKSVKRTVSRKGAKKAATRKTRKGARAGSAFMKPLKPSAALAVIVGPKPLPRTEAVKKLWKYIKAHKLQDPKNLRMICPDTKLKPVLGSRDINMLKLGAALNKHLSAL